MKTRIKYFVLIIILCTLCTIIPVIITNAKYLYNVKIESDVSIGTMVFNIKQLEGECNVYQLEKGGQIVAKYKLRNKDDKNNINTLDLKYYLKIVDNNQNEIDDFDILVNNYNYVKYNVDEKGNIINEDGDIVDEEGQIVLERKLSEEENQNLQQSLVTIKKGYGPINLSYDGKTIDEKEIDITIKCPSEYLGSKNLNYKVKIIAEGLFNKNFTAEEYAQLNIEIDDIIEQNSNTDEIVEQQSNANEIVEQQSNANEIEEQQSNANEIEEQQSNANNININEITDNNLSQQNTTNSIINDENETN